MPNTLQHLLSQMDEKHWMRLIVCILPGLILSKLASYEGVPVFLRIAASLALVSGIGIYAAWRLIRRSDTEGDDVADMDEEDRTAVAADVAAAEVPVETSISQLSKLHVTCAGDFEEVLHLLRMEAALHPEKSLPAVIAEAHHRRTFSLRSRSGSLKS